MPSSHQSKKTSDKPMVSYHHQQEQPKRHSEEYFDKLTKDLQDDIKKNHLPKTDQSALDVFVSSCKSLQTAKTSLQGAQDLLSRIQKDDPTNDDAIQAAQAVVDSCQETVDNINDLVTASGKVILNNLDLSMFWQKDKRNSNKSDGSDDVEAKLLRCTVLVQGTAKGLAEWVSLNPKMNGKLIDDFLSNIDWMKQMVIHGGGASKGNYGPAIEIHSKLLKSLYDCNNDGCYCCPPKVYHKLALAVALELCTPIPIFKNDEKTIQQFVDPECRFWNYIKAYERGELDKSFDTFSVWELRLVIDSNATDDELQWGRDYLKAYRPDEMLMDSDRWRYAWAVRSDVGYRHPDHPFNNYKQLLSAGGECGPRAFFGRFICKAFGTPTWGVRQPGHAAMSRWTPDGWTICLGAAFIFSWWEDNRYTGGNNQSQSRPGPDFEEETKARMKTCPRKFDRYLTTLECLAECLDETIIYDINYEKRWRSLALVQRRIFASSDDDDNPNDTQLKGSTNGVLPRENESLDLNSVIPTSTITGISWKEQPFIVMCDDPLSLIIPATSFISPEKPTKSVIPMMSYLGGTQLHIEDGGEVSYALPPAPVINEEGGDYLLSCRIVNVHEIQVPLCISFFYDDKNKKKKGNQIEQQYSIEICYTAGGWQRTDPIKVRISPGFNMKVTRQKGCHGLTIKDFLFEKC